MKCNVGGIDRAIRIILGLALILWAIFTSNYWGYLGILLLLTGLCGRCGIYQPFGFSSCKTKSDEK